MIADPTPPDGWTGRVALVTGAAQGIGAAVTRLLAARGVQVMAADIQTIPPELRALPGVHAAPLDVTDPADVERVVARTERDLGPTDFLVNVAGILRPGLLSDLSLDDWHRTFAVNTTGPFVVSRAAARSMQARGRGAIVTVGSNAAHVPRHGMGAYAASKAATTHLMRCLALELAPHGVRCNVVSPGSTDTAMQRQLWTDPAAPQRVIQGDLGTSRLGIPLGRIADPDDIARAALFLLSDDARHITMQHLTVDGGATLGA
ncbi:2,3-dihydro-2,3-dihydroxybenzoate dehydrogenase [Deinococcus knuensis]|uniref:2,3-dihydro-2,3-dihydroxybenzoate dehydrogenase n=1 Tax=Deinococcus knuensis TaxID=1837380 RepID=A0ABQ2SHC7_9DEIO|nr:2,3-dihydro-2,3-dihydroxybenzoate dehydrogenase [Deinococcus knuensis]GGS25418.1 2,3-dihydro-2,3-dihydroxybenzoate dehydrogenase [Deinococcus knuensis]